MQESYFNTSKIVINEQEKLKIQFYFQFHSISLNFHAFIIISILNFHMNICLHQDPGLQLSWADTCTPILWQIASGGEYPLRSTAGGGAGQDILGKLHQTGGIVSTKWLKSNLSDMLPKNNLNTWEHQYSRGSISSSCRCFSCLLPFTSPWSSSISLVFFRARFERSCAAFRS